MNERENEWNDGQSHVHASAIVALVFFSALPRI